MTIQQQKLGILIDFKTKKVIKQPLKEKDEKEKAIKFLSSLIEELKKDKFNPKKCLVLMEWEDNYQYWHNNLKLEELLSMLDLNKNLILNF